MSALEDDGESSNSEMVDTLEDDASESSKKEEWKKERAIQLGYEPQKEIVYNKILPYAGIVIFKDYFHPNNMNYYQLYDMNFTFYSR